jgi:hypothetical protein
MKYHNKYDNICVTKKKYMMFKLHDSVGFGILYYNSTHSVNCESRHFTHMWKW